MALTTFTSGQILTAAQMNAVQANDYNQTVSTKTASYTLVAADKGTRVVMNSASATTITVNTSLFNAGDTLFLQNISTGVCTVTAGTATVSSAGSLAIPQNGSGLLYFTSAGVSIFYPSAAAGGVLQIVSFQTGAVATGTTRFVRDDTIPQNTEGDQYMSLAITPKSAASNLFIQVCFGCSHTVATELQGGLFRDSTADALAATGTVQRTGTDIGIVTFNCFTTSNSTTATTFKVRAGGNNAGTMTFNGLSGGRQYGGVYASTITITEYSA